MPTQPEYDKPHPSTVRGEGHHPWCWNKPRPDRWPDVVKQYLSPEGIVSLRGHTVLFPLTTTYPDPMSTICHVGKNDNLAECEGCMHKETKNG